MSAGTRLSLAKAERLANEVVALLAPACERVGIAGSIRRRKPDIGDIEIVAIPKTDARLQSDMFGEQIAEPMDVLHPQVLGLIDAGVFAPRLNKDGRQSIGPALKWLTYRGFGLDLYTATRETWGVTLVIRTGSAEFSHKMVTPRSQAGFCPSHLEVKGWRVRRRAGGEQLPTSEETDVFAVLGLEWMEPCDRTDTARPRFLANV